MRYVVILTAALLAAGAAPAPAPEPAGLWQGAMHGSVPATLKGARVLDTAAFARLRERLHPLLLDVAEQEKKPESLPSDLPWMPTHRTIPGAVWLAGGGFGNSDPVYAAAYLTRVAALAGRDRDRPIVVFCHPHCWGSWNAAKRLVLAGYKQVYWYPEGVEGWQGAGLDTQVARPDPIWMKALSPSKSNRSESGRG